MMRSVFIRDQWVAAGTPFRRPAAPNIKAPVQTDAVLCVVRYTARSHASASSSTICSGVAEPPGTNTISGAGVSESACVTAISRAPPSATIGPTSRPTKRVSTSGRYERISQGPTASRAVTPGYRRIATCWVMLLFSVKTCQLSALGAGVMNGDTHRARRRRYRRSRPSPTRHRVCRPPDSYRRKPKRLARICRLEAKLLKVNR